MHKPVELSRYRAIINTHESKDVFSRNVRYVSPIWGNSPDPRRSGYIYDCPLCDFVSPVMKHRLGGEHQGERHQRYCLKG